MDVLDSPYYFQCRTYLGIFGVWSLHPLRTKRFLRVISYFFWLTIFIPSLCKAYQSRHQFYYFLICLPSLAFYIQYFVKLTYLIHKDSQFKQLLELIKKDFRSYSGKNLKILHCYAREAAKINKIYAYYLLGIVYTFNMSSFVQLLNGTLLKKFSQNLMKNNFSVMALHNFVLDIFTTLLIIGFDTLLLIFTQHGCALFKIVVREIKSVLDRYDKSTKSVLYKELTRVIELHKRAIHFVELLESTYATQQLLITGLMLAAITISEFEATANRTHFSVRFRFAVYGIGELIHILFHNYPGQRIRDHSLMIYQSCYNSGWYREDVPNECRKLLSLMMLRSQKPCCLTGGGWYILGLENYVAILKASLTYFTFLSSIQ